MGTVISILCGAAVCAFGMWAFLKGQNSMAEIRHGRPPANLKGPAAVLRETLAQARDEKEKSDYAAQLKSLFGDGEPGK